MRSLTNFPLSEHDALLSANAHFALARNYRGITDQLDQFAATGAVSPSLLNSPRSPTMAIRPNANGHIGRPVADVPHFYLDRGFEFGGCFARFLHGSIDPTRNIKFVAFDRSYPVTCRPPRYRRFLCSRRPRFGG